MIDFYAELVGTVNIQVLWILWERFFGGLFVSFCVGEFFLVVCCDFVVVEVFFGEPGVGFFVRTKMH